MNGRLDIEQSGAVLQVRIDAPPDNLFSPEMARQLAMLLERPPAGAHVLRLSAEGEHFCLGRAPFREGVDELQADVQGLVELNRALVDSPLVTVAEVQGDAAGFGAGIVALSDVAVASPDARLSFPEVDAGFAPALVLSWLVPMVGRQAAFWLTATGEPISAAEGRSRGLLALVADDRQSLSATVARTVDLLVSKPAGVHREIKRLMRFYATVPEGPRSEAAADRLSLGALRLALADHPDPVPTGIGR